MSDDLSLDTPALEALVRTIRASMARKRKPGRVNQDWLAAQRKRLSRIEAELQLRKYQKQSEHNPAGDVNAHLTVIRTAISGLSRSLIEVAERVASGTTAMLMQDIQEQLEELKDRITLLEELKQREVNEDPSI